MRSGVDSKMIQIHPEFVGAVQDAETYEAAMAFARGQGWPTTTVVNADVDSLVTAIGRGRVPAVSLIDIDNASDPQAKIAQLVKVCGNRGKVMAIGSANDVSFYRSMLQAGAVDYLVKPLSSVVLRDAIMPLLASKDSQNSGKKGKTARVYAVIGVRGGVGATTLAVNSAWVLAHDLSEKTALVDLDLQYGNCDLALDLEPARGLREVLLNPDRVDGLLINSSMAKESDYLSVFCCEDSLEEVVEFETAGPMALIKELRTDYEHIVIDMPRELVPRHRRLLVAADHIFLVTDLTLAGIRDVQRVASAISNLGISGQIHYVAGRVGDGEAQVNRATFERSAKGKVELLVPHDPKTIRLSASKGKSISAVGQGTQLLKAVRQLASMMAGKSLTASGTATGGGFLSGLLGRRG